MAMTPRRIAAVLSQLQKWKDGARSEIEKAREEAAAEEPSSTGGAAARAAAPRAAAAPPGQARTWTFKDWFASLDFADAFARCVQGQLCTSEGEDSSEFMLTFVRTMHEQGSKEALLELLMQCGALTVLVDSLWDGGCELVRTGAVTGKELNEKFLQQEENFEMSYGTITDFFGGLEKFVGAPDPMLRHAMEREHCCMKDADLEFTAGNYGITTTPRTEWLFATGGEPPAEGWPQETRNCKPGHERKPRSHEWLVQATADVSRQLRALGEPQLIEEEAIGLRLYTGPMFQIYNSLLRALARKKKVDEVRQELEKLQANRASMQEREKEELRHKEELLESMAAGMKRFEGALRKANSYTTTIHVINSGLVKLGKMQKAEKVYRGISGGILPKEFWEPNESGVCGGVEHGFLSTTGNREVAMAYAASDRKKAGTVFEIQMGMVDRGANLQWVSQYPHEAELCFAPLTGLQVLATRVEKSVLIVEARLNVNLVSLTIEEVIAKRHKMMTKLCEELCDEVEHAVIKADGDWQPVAEALFPDEEARPNHWQNSVARLRESMAACMAEDIISGSPQEMNDNTKFVEAVHKAVQIKNDFTRPTHVTVVSFLSTPTTRITMEPHFRDVTRTALRNVTSWPNLPNMMHLDISWSDVTDGSLEVLVQRCPNLHHANLSGCVSITDTGVKYIAEGCKNVRQVNFSRCMRITDNATKYLGKGCKALQHAEFSGCDGITDGGVKNLAEGCEDLQHAIFSGCAHVTDTAAKHLAEGCTNLTHANFSMCDGIKDGAAKHLAGGCKKLQHVDWSGCVHITDSTAKDLAGGCTDLRHVNFSGCVGITDTGATCIADACKHLEFADFSGCVHVTATTAKHLAGCHSLHHVNFAGCVGITDNCVKSLADGCHGLQYANFSGCKKVTDNSAKSLAKGCKNLLHVNLSQCERISDNAVKQLAEACKHLQHADFSDCVFYDEEAESWDSHITDIAAKHLADGCKELLHANFAGCKNLTDAAVKYLAEGCKHLRHANFSGCERITDEGAKHLADGCKELQHADFSDTICDEEEDENDENDVEGCADGNITDKAAEYLAGGCKNLLHANFARRRQVTDLAAKHLGEGCKKLQHANFSGCVAMTDEAAKFLAQGCRDLLHADFSECLTYEDEETWDSRITDAAAKHLAEGCAGLQHANFSNCKKLTDEAAKHLAQHCKHLQQANFTGCEEVTEHAAELLRSAAPGCKVIR